PPPREDDMPELILFPRVGESGQFATLADHSDGEVLAACVPLPARLRHLAEVDRTLGYENHVGPAGDAAHHRDPAGLAALHPDDPLRDEVLEDRLDQAAPSLAHRHDVPAGRVRAAHDGTDDRVQPGAVAAPGEDADALRHAGPSLDAPSGADVECARDRASAR